MNSVITAALTFRSPTNAVEGHTVERTIDASGLITEEYTNASGELLRRDAQMPFQSMDDHGNEIPGIWDKLTESSKAAGWTLIRRAVLTIENLEVDNGNMN